MESCCAESERGGVIVCVVTMAVTAAFAFSPFPSLNGDLAGFLGMTAFGTGLIITAARWKY